MAQLISTSALKPGMVVVSQRVIKQVYSFGTDLDQCRKFPMRGKAMVLQEMTKVRLKTKKQKWNVEKAKYDQYDSFITKNMVLMSHYKYGIVMYFAYRENDCTWRLSEKDNKNE